MSGVASRKFRNREEEEMRLGVGRSHDSGISKLRGRVKLA